MESAEAEARALARRISGMLDRSMRAAYVRHILAQMHADQVADMFVVALAISEARDRGHPALLQAMSLALADASMVRLRDAVRAVLESRGQIELALTLSGPSADPEDEDALRVPDFGVGRPLSLGERKSLARKNDRDLIARVMRDPHPDVIRILLHNPGLTESDVVRVSARRPVPVDVLREVFRSPRWIARHRVKVALALNPRTPLDISLQMLPHLTVQDLRRIRRAPELEIELRRAADRLIGRGKDTTLH